MIFLKRMYFFSIVFSLCLGVTTLLHPEQSFGSIASKPVFFEDDLDSEFCDEWNPEFKFRGKRCCAKISFRGQRLPLRCAPKRKPHNLCAESTETQQDFTAETLEELEWNSSGRQAQCSADNGFLVNGTPLLPTKENALQLSNPKKCANYGTNGLVMLLNRLGRSIAQRFYNKEEYQGVKLTIGDLSGPRGGCLPTRRGAHRGHTNGLDADVAFLEAKPYQESSHFFHHSMNVELNWWLLKSMVQASPVCVQYIFVDRSHISKLRKFAQSLKDPMWALIAPVLKHIPGHKNHFHIRVGTEPRAEGPLSCTALATASANSEHTETAGKTN